MGRGITRISRVPCETAKRGGASRVPPSPGATARRTRGVLVEGATPLFGPLVRHQRGGRSLHSDPCGKAVESAKKPALEGSRAE